MKAKGTRQLRTRQAGMGNRHFMGESGRVRYLYHYAILFKRSERTEDGGWCGYSWDNIPHEHWNEGIKKVVTECLNEWWDGGQGTHGLLTFRSEKGGYTRVAMFSLDALELSKFYTRHPEDTMRPIIAFGEHGRHRFDLTPFGEGTVEAEQSERIGVA